MNSFDSLLSPLSHLELSKKRNTLLSFVMMLVRANNP